MSLLKAREAVMQKFIPHLREQGLSPQQWRVLRALYDETNLEMSELSERCYLLMPSLSRIVQNLEARELVSRTTSVKDQRCSIIGLTDDGARLVGIIAPQSESRYEYITQAYGYGKLELLYELLDELVEKLQDPELENKQEG